MSLAADLYLHSKTFRFVEFSDVDNLVDAANVFDVAGSKTVSTGAEHHVLF